MGLPPGIFTGDDVGTDPGVDVPIDPGDGISIPTDGADGDGVSTIMDDFNKLFASALGGYRVFETITGRPGESATARPRDQGGPTGKGISGENKPGAFALSPTMIGWILLGAAVSALVLALVLKAMGKA